MVWQISGSGAAKGPAALGVGGRAASRASPSAGWAKLWRVHRVAALVCHAPIEAKAGRAGRMRAAAQPDAQRIISIPGRGDGDDRDGVAIDIGDDTLVIGVADFHV